MWARDMVSEERGVVAPIVGVLLVVLLGFAAFAVDTGYILVTKNELQNIADATAQAGSRQLGRIYAGLPTPATYQLTSADTGAITTAVATVAQNNRAAGQAIQTVNATDIHIGQWDTATRSLTVTSTNPNAVAVTVRREAGTNGPISTFFAKILGRDTVGVVAQATAALAPLCELPPGGVRLPVGIGTQAAACGTSIRLSTAPALTPPSACASWTTFNQSATATNVQNLLTGASASPALQTGDTLNFVSSLSATNLRTGLQGLTGVTQSTIAVYSGCAPAGSTGIVGFAHVTITAVQAAADPRINPSITVQVDCTNDPLPGPPGSCPYFGVASFFPTLVQ